MRRGLQVVFSTGVFADNMRRCLRLDVTSVNSAISACGSVTKWREALDLARHVAILGGEIQSRACVVGQGPSSSLWQAPGIFGP